MDNHPEKGKGAEAKSESQRSDTEIQFRRISVIMSTARPTGEPLQSSHSEVSPYLPVGTPQVDVSNVQSSATGTEYDANAPISTVRPSLGFSRRVSFEDERISQGKDTKTFEKDTRSRNLFKCKKCEKSFTKRHQLSQHEECIHPDHPSSSEASTSQDSQPHQMVLRSRTPPTLQSTDDTQNILSVPITSSSGAQSFRKQPNEMVISSESSISKSSNLYKENTRSKYPNYKKRFAEEYARKQQENTQSQVSLSIPEPENTQHQMVLRSHTPPTLPSILWGQNLTVSVAGSSGLQSSYSYQQSDDHQMILRCRTPPNLPTSALETQTNSSIPVTDSSAVQSSYHRRTGSDNTQTIRRFVSITGPAINVPTVGPARIHTRRGSSDTSQARRRFATITEPVINVPTVGPARIHTRRGSSDTSQARRRFATITEPVINVPTVVPARIQTRHWSSDIRPTSPTCIQIGHTSSDTSQTINTDTSMASPADIQSRRRTSSDISLTSFSSDPKTGTDAPMTSPTDIQSRRRTSSAISQTSFSSGSKTNNVPTAQPTGQKTSRESSFNTSKTKKAKLETKRTPVGKDNKGRNIYNCKFLICGKTYKSLKFLFKHENNAHQLSSGFEGSPSDNSFRAQQKVLRNRTPPNLENNATGTQNPVAGSSVQSSFQSSVDKNKNYKCGYSNCEMWFSDFHSCKQHEKIHFEGSNIAFQFRPHSEIPNPDDHQMILRSRSPPENHNIVNIQAYLSDPVAGPSTSQSSSHNTSKKRKKRPKSVGKGKSYECPSCKMKFIRFISFKSHKKTCQTILNVPFHPHNIEDIPAASKSSLKRSNPNKKLSSRKKYLGSRVLRPRRFNIPVIGGHITSERSSSTSSTDDFNAPEPPPYELTSSSTFSNEKALPLSFRKKPHAKHSKDKDIFICKFKKCGATYMADYHCQRHEKTHLEPSRGSLLYPEPMWTIPSTSESPSDFPSPAQSPLDLTLPTNVPLDLSPRKSKERQNVSNVEVYTCATYDSTVSVAGSSGLQFSSHVHSSETETLTKSHVTESSIVDKKKYYKCSYPNCKEKFVRLASLVQHKITHADVHLNIPSRSQYPLSAAKHLKSFDDVTLYSLAEKAIHDYYIMTSSLPAEPVDVVESPPVLPKYSQTHSGSSPQAKWSDKGGHSKDTTCKEIPRIFSQSIDSSAAGSSGVQSSPPTQDTDTPSLVFVRYPSIDPLGRRIYKCKYTECRMTGSFIRFIENHEKFDHASLSCYKCHFSDCWRFFLSEENLQQHEKSHEGDEHHYCKYSHCKKVFRSEYGLQQHQQQRHRRANLHNE